MTLEMPKEQKDILDKWLPFGMKKLVINSAISDICYMLEKYGSNYISAIVRKELNHRIEMDELPPKETRNGSDCRPEHPAPAGA